MLNISKNEHRRALDTKPKPVKKASRGFYSSSFRPKIGTEKAAQ